MTEPEVRPDQGRARRSAAVILVFAVVVVGGLLALVVGAGGGDPRPTTSAAALASPAVSDLPLVTVPPSPTAATPASAATAPVPDTASPSADTLNVRASRIRIDRLGIDLAIIDGDGIDAPIGKAAHYPGSAWPGGGSNIYIYGHAQEGMFITLWQARTGDEIELDLVDGTTRTYVVSNVLPKVPWDAVEYLEPTTTEQLTLQTSTSYYPTAPRFIVIAVPAS